MSDEKAFRANDAAAVEQQAVIPGATSAFTSGANSMDRDEELMTEKEWRNRNSYQNSVFPWTTVGLKEYVMMDVDPAQSSGPLSAFCFMTGFIDSISFSAIFVWCGFQTGNSVQLALALARLFSPGQTDFSFRTPDRQALTSLLTFLFGAFLGRIGDKIGNKTRLWLMLGTIIQALFSMAAALTIWKNEQGSVADDRGSPAWTGVLSYVALGFASASIGLQGIMGKRVNTQFATTVVLTTVWCELMADPKLFTRGWVISRDHKVIGVVALFVGGFVGRALIDVIGAKGAFGVGAGIRLLIAFSWLWIPAKVNNKVKGGKA